jgi:HD superfamily phosphodiesterase
MNRTEKLREHIDKVLLDMIDTEDRRCAYLHLYSVSMLAAMIAMKRGENAELATIAGMLHDFYTYAKTDMKDHAHKGAPFSRNVLETLGITTDEETEIICNAIYNHSDKGETGSSFDEVLKDADVLQHCLYNITLPPMTHEAERFEKLKKEFGLGI